MEQILTYNTTAMRSASLSRDALRETFVGWEVECAFEYYVLRPAKTTNHDVDNNDSSDGDMESIAESRDDDEFDETVVHQVVFILTKPRGFELSQQVDLRAV